MYICTYIYIYIYIYEYIYNTLNTLQHTAVYTAMYRTHMTRVHSLSARHQELDAVSEKKNMSAQFLKKTKSQFRDKVRARER